MQLDLGTMSNDGLYLYHDFLMSGEYRLALI